MAILAVDFGKKFVGLAWSPDGIVILPIGIFSAESAESEIRKISDEKSIKKIVIGLPTSGDGSENAWCEEVRDFGRKIRSNAEIFFVNERFSTQTTPSMPRGRVKMPVRTDDLSAMRILELFLKRGL